MNALAKTIRGFCAMRWKHGRQTVEAKAREILENGGGLSEKQIEEFFARVERARRRKLGEPRGAVDEFRGMIEARSKK